MLKTDNRITHLDCGVKSLIVEEVYSKGLRKHPAGLVGKMCSSRKTSQRM